MFSVVIPAYKAQSTIARAVSSVLNQTLPAKEIIIVSDDSVDYRQYVDHAIVRYVNSGGIGLGSGHARNKGIEAATYDWIAMLDADDEFHPYRLELLTPMVEKYHAAFTATHYVSSEKKALENINLIVAAEQLSPLEFALSGMHTHVHVAFHRVHCPARYDVSAGPDDFVFGMKLYDFVPVIGYVPQPLYYYYRTEGSICNQAGSAKKFLAVIDRFLNPNSNEFSLVSRYKAWDTLRQYLECMRAAEIAVIDNPALDFRQVMRAKAETMLFSLVAGL